MKHSILFLSLAIGSTSVLAETAPSLRYSSQNCSLAAGAEACEISLKTMQSRGSDTTEMKSCKNGFAEGDFYYGLQNWAAPQTESEQEARLNKVLKEWVYEENSRCLKKYIRNVEKKKRISHGTYEDFKQGYSLALACNVFGNMDDSLAWFQDKNENQEVAEDTPDSIETIKTEVIPTNCLRPEFYCLNSGERGELSQKVCMEGHSGGLFVCKLYPKLCADLSDRQNTKAFELYKNHWFDSFQKKTAHPRKTLLRKELEELEYKMGFQNAGTCVHLYPDFYALKN